MAQHPHVDVHGALRDALSRIASLEAALSASMMRERHARDALRATQQTAEAVARSRGPRLTSIDNDTGAIDAPGRAVASPLRASSAGRSRSTWAISALDADTTNGAAASIALLRRENALLRHRNDALASTLRRAHRGTSQTRSHADVHTHTHTLAAPADVKPPGPAASLSPPSPPFFPSALSRTTAALSALASSEARCRVLSAAVREMTTQSAAQSAIIRTLTVRLQQHAAAPAEGTIPGQRGSQAASRAPASESHAHTHAHAHTEELLALLHEYRDQHTRDAETVAALMEELAAARKHLGLGREDASVPVHVLEHAL